MQIKLIQVPGPEEVARVAVEELIKIAVEATAAKGVFTLALSGGSTPKRMYQLLADSPYREQVDWSAIRLFWGDERPVPPDHADSNYHMTVEALLSKVDVPPSHVFRMPADRSDADAAAREYEAQIAEVFGITSEGELPSFDLILLGLGPDGHTASLFPETAALSESERWVVPNYVPKFDATRMTLTYPILNNAKNVFFLVVGAEKAAVVAEILEGPREPERLPAQGVRPEDGKLHWLMDRAAMAKLDRFGIPPEVGGLVV